MTLLANLSSAASVAVYNTGFEASEGYSQFNRLVGHQGWLGTGTGGNGIYPEFSNQDAYIGFYAPSSGNELYTSVWRPLNVPTIPAGYIVRFSVDLTIVDSVDRQAYDEFRWSVYNTNGNRLFTVIFDNDSLDILYITSSGATVQTPARFVWDAKMNFVLTMDFARNRWGASLGGTNLVTNSLITESCLPLNLGDIDAVWFYHDPTYPGDNYMLFDNYRVTLESSNAISQTVQVLCSDSQHLAVRSFGQPGQKYALQVNSSSMLLSNSWVSLFTNTAPATGYFDYSDNYATSPVRRYYRTRLIP
jgi:hypothetical protein